MNIANSPQMDDTVKAFHSRCVDFTCIWVPPDFARSRRVRWYWRTRAAASLSNQPAQSLRKTGVTLLILLDSLLLGEPHALHSLDPQAGVDIAAVKERYGKAAEAVTDGLVDIATSSKKGVYVFLQEKGVSQKTIRRASVASYELEINIAIHSNGGRLIFNIDEEKITIIAKDDGPGMPDVEMALKEGFSTANDWIRSLGFGAGMGLPNTRRFSDEFDIKSVMGKGTIVKSIIFLNENKEGSHEAS